VVQVIKKQALRRRSEPVLMIGFIALQDPRIGNFQWWP
jgi:hypothetical protein